jgi:hypothetical protein
MAKIRQAKSKVNCSLLFNEQTKDITCRRDPDDILHFNIQQQWIHHSPDGFEWGYGGSGPADFALNILRVHGLPWSLAWKLHHKFKFEFLDAGRPYLKVIGGTIKAEHIRMWIEAELCQPDMVQWLCDQVAVLDETLQTMESNLWAIDREATP